MKRIFFILGLLLPLMVIILSSNSQSVMPQNPKIGTFELYRTINKSDIVLYFGEPSESNISTRDNENGEETSVYNNYYYKPNSSRTLVEISIMEDRIEGLCIYVRDIKYAINGKLMVGDNISKVTELGYEVQDLYGAKGKVLYPPVYKRGTSEICYYFEVYYDANNIITRISMLEETGV